MTRIGLIFEAEGPMENKVISNGSFLKFRENSPRVPNLKHLDDINFHASTLKKQLFLFL